MAEQGQSAKKAPATASIRYGVYNQPGNYVGKTVAQVRADLAPQWGIPNDAQAFKGKDKLSEDYVVQEGDHLELHRRMGEKGYSA
jgi:hypothetical protein